MKAIIQPSRVKGTIHAPASKSSMQRALAAALLINGQTTIFNPGHSNDDKAVIEIIKALGASIATGDGRVVIQSNGIVPVANEVNCGESGLAIRMFTPLIALSEKQLTINGSGSLLNRPMDFFDTILPELGVAVTSNNGKMPLTVQGPLKPSSVEVDGSLSSQFITGLLMAYAAAGAGDVTIQVKDLKSKPYIDLTLEVMKRFGMKLPSNSNYEAFHFSNDNHKTAGNQTIEYTVEGDWSGGAFLLVAGAIAGPLTVTGLDLTSTQADSAIIDALMDANAGIAIEAKGIRIHPTAMKGFYFDATDCPDLFPPLVALAAHCKGQTRIKGISRLIHKESNRAIALQDEFDKMGVVIDFDGDEMLIQGTAKVRGADVESHHDHRIAMACAVAGLRADSEMVIDNAEAVNKSYPDFYENLKSLGADVSLDNKIKWHE